MKATAGNLIFDILNPCLQIRSSCTSVVLEARHVTLNEDAIDAFAKQIVQSVSSKGNLLQPVEWDECGWHFSDGGSPLTCQYIFVMDALNYCFWPTENNFEYDTLAVSLKKVLEGDRDAFSAENLISMTSANLQSWFPIHEVPLLEERVLCLRELGAALLNDFDGLAINMVKAADGSSTKLVRLITSHFPHFRDTSVYRGKLIYFYKRAQILVGDLWAAYGKQKDTAHPCCFNDIDQLTMFADYRVPQILREMNILEYSASLASAIDLKQTIPWGSEEETEIRALTIVAVDRLQEALKKNGVHLLAIECDWLLWQRGEQLKDSIAPHHRTLTVYY